MFLDQSGFMLQPVCRRTWAPQGQTPILRQWDRHDRLSVISALTLAPRRRRYGLYWMSYPHNIRNEQVLRFLRALRRHLPRGFTLIWDGHSAHQAQAVEAWLARQRRIVVEPLPAYAPELNPVEQVWNHTKNVDLANHTPDSLAAVADTVEGALTGTSGEQALLDGFMRETELEPMYHYLCKGQERSPEAVHERSLCAGLPPLKELLRDSVILQSIPACSAIHGYRSLKRGRHHVHGQKHA